MALDRKEVPAIPDTGNQHTFSVPIGAAMQLFVRLSVTSL
jgi:hypothetical protein